ncbi:nucleotidyltransferase domain-containing protein [Alloiococcus sp. CFN-8]|uniref:nucleotidyltransferase domain-containing protein n=1 Tax=Alloiococcus sp. CFN-8 TaxID=3416081 RepID=UPI003CF7DFDF
MIEEIINEITASLQECSFIEGVVLGGSRATRTATEASDIDIGIYYHSDKLDYDKLNTAAKELDDTHRENLISREGQWGNWVNCGGWLVIKGYQVDLILRDIKRVEKIIDQTDKGITTSNYQPGHPHAYIDVMYRGELASSKILYSRDSYFLQLKKRAEKYPEVLRKALIDFFSFEADFSSMLAEKYSNSQDSYYIAGHMFRSVSALNQVLFAFNRVWCLNEKKAIFRIDTFEYKPEGYSEKVNYIFDTIGKSQAASAKKLRQLCEEVAEVTGT